MIYGKPFRPVAAKVGTHFADPEHTAPLRRRDAFEPWQGAGLTCAYHR